jgi:hypothetical protein
MASGGADLDDHDRRVHGSSASKDGRSESIRRIVDDYVSREQANLAHDV